MFWRKNKEKLTREQKLEIKKQNFKQNLAKHLTIKLGLIIWFLSTSVLIKYFGNKITLQVIALIFIVSLFAGYLTAGFLSGKYKDKILIFFGINDKKNRE